VVGVSRFSLHPRLAADTLPVGEMKLSCVLLMDDERFPWLVLVPRRQGLEELADLSVGERAILIEEIAAASLALSGRPRVDKINVGALGNVVRQLHIHVVARVIGDEAWPGPAWGAGERRPYKDGAAKSLALDLARALAIVPAK
jgi:diadenosine tetraphosphate (Ap4A) HIT family hydrolase